MEGIKLLIVIFGLLFILERKPMNILFNFIALVITVAILLAKSIGMDYLSYLLIIIYCSALTIIFGFVIMLTPNYSYFNEIKRGSFLIPFLCHFAVIITALIFYHPFDIILGYDGSMENNENVIMKIGNLLYREEINIIKLMIATLILYFALVALFFVLMATTSL